MDKRTLNRRDTQLTRQTAGQTNIASEGHAVDTIDGQKNGIASEENAVDQIDGRTNGYCIGGACS